MSRFRASAQITQEWHNFGFAIADGVATVTLNRPEKLNALTFEAYADLRDLLAELPYRGDTRVLVLRGQGRGFCGGGDVNEIIGELIKMEARDLLQRPIEPKALKTPRNPNPPRKPGPGSRGASSRCARCRRASSAGCRTGPRPDSTPA